MADMKKEAEALDAELQIADQDDDDDDAPGWQIGILAACFPLLFNAGFAGPTLCLPPPQKRPGCRAPRNPVCQAGETGEAGSPGQERA